MEGTHVDEDRLLSRSEIAELAGVRRPAVTNWERRHRDYPVPVRAGEIELFGLRAMLRWLGPRRIPVRGRQADEPEGTTYAERVRRKLAAAGAARAAEEDPGGGADHEADGAADERQRRADLERLLGPLAAAVRGGGSMPDYLTLLISLVFLRLSEGPRWADLPFAVRDRPDAAAADLLAHIGDLVDEGLRRRGVAPGMRVALLRLEPRRFHDLSAAIDATESLGLDDFRFLVDTFGAEARLGSAEFLTPRPVVRLMRDVAVTDAAAVRHVYDPYARAGEMLDAAATGLRGGVPLTLRGESPTRATFRFAAMNLALHEAVSARLTRGEGAPWNSGAWPPEPTADLVLTNPPFTAVRDDQRVREPVGWPYGAPPPGATVFAWLQHVLLALRDGGRGCVVMPVGAGASSDPREGRIRGQAVERGAVECVVALPPQLFGQTQVSVCLWFLHKTPVPGTEVLFVDAAELGDKTSRGPRTLTDEHIGGVVATVRQWRDRRGFRPGRQPAGHVAVAAPLQAVRDAGYSLSAADYIDRWMSDAMPPDAALQEVTDGQSRLSAASAHAVAAGDRARALSFASPGRARDVSYDGLPQGWRRVRLEELAEIKAGPSYSRMTADRRTAGGEVPVVMPRHLRGGRVDHRDVQKVTEEVARPLGNYRLEAGDILCVRTGAQMLPAMAGDAERGWLFGTNLMRLRLLTAQDGPAVELGYLMAYLCLPETMRWLRERARATVIPSLSVHTLGQLPVNLPSPAQQREISAALNAVDAQIAAHQEAAEAATRHRAALAAHLMTGTLTTVTRHHGGAGAPTRARHLPEGRSS